MNQQNRNGETIAKNEDTALDRYLKDRDEQRCEKCEDGTPYIMHDDAFICQSCYEDLCERGEYLSDCEEDR